MTPGTLCKISLVPTAVTAVIIGNLVSMPLSYLLLATLALLLPMMIVTALALWAYNEMHLYRYLGWKEYDGWKRSHLTWIGSPATDETNPPAKGL